MEQLNKFWNLVIDVWHQGLYGIDIGRILVAILIFIGFLIIRRLFSKLVIGRLKAITRLTQSTLDDEALEVLAKPVGFIPVVLGFYLATEYLSLTGDLATIADRIVRSLIVLVLFWGLIKLVAPLSHLVRHLEKVLTGTMVDWLIKAIHAALVFVGAATVLEIWGIRIGPILAGLGLFGVAVALGAQDLFKNLIAGILIIVERRFHRGDWIKVDGVVEGTVESIGFRSTLVQRFDKAPVIVPNARFADNSVINFSAMTHRRIYWMIGLEYRTSIDQLRRIRNEIENYLLSSDSFAHPPEVSLFVRVDRFNDSSIDLMVYCFTKTTVWGEWLQIKETLAYKVKEIVEAAGAAFAFPSQSVYLETLPDEQAEVFVPPPPQGTKS